LKEFVKIVNNLSNYMQLNSKEILQK